VPLSAPAWRVAATVAAPGLRIMLRRRATRGKEVAARLSERWGVAGAARPAGPLAWMHAASVGEAESTLPVLAAMDRLAPAVQLLVTTGTVTSAAMLAGRLGGMGLGRVVHQFIPLDVPGWVERFLDHWRPDAGAFVESELWPNLVLACGRRGMPLMVVNGRMSAASARGWRWAPGLVRAVLGCFAVVQAGSEADARQFRALGAQRVEVLGNLKLSAPALPVNDAELARLQGLLAERPRWVAASTHPGEETLVGEIHRELLRRFPELVTVVVPRHPERGAAISALLGGAPRRSLGEGPPAGGIWVADTLGELGLFYRLCGVAFVGRSLVAPGGGQNPWEPARLGCAVAVGPFVGNFREAVGQLESVGALARVEGAAGLAAWADAMLRDPLERAKMGAAGRQAATGGPALDEEVARRLLGLVGV